MCVCVVDVVCVCQVRVWEIPEGGLRKNLSQAVLELYGHSRRVGLIEWHPTCSGLLFSSGYDFKVHIHYGEWKDGLQMWTNSFFTIAEDVVIK